MVVTSQNDTNVDEERSLPSCPACHSIRIYKDGYRSTSNVRVQRYLCRECGLRFSEPRSKLIVKDNVAGEVFVGSYPNGDLSHYVITRSDLSSKEPSEDLSLLSGENVATHDVTTVGQDLNTLCDNYSTRRVGASKTEVKNLVATETEEARIVVAGETPPYKSLLFNYSWYLKKQGFAESTIKSRESLLHVLVKRGTNLLDSEDVKKAIYEQKWCNKRKVNAVDAYTRFLDMQGMTWDPPRYRFASTLPFIPTEAELDALIAGCGPKTSTFLLLLKETGARSGEIHKLKWTDIDSETKTLRITPEKGSYPRIFKISNRLVNMLSVIHLNNAVSDPKRIFAHDLNSVRNSYLKQRKTLARKLQNPRLTQIHFHTFRHWKGTILYHQTKDLLFVQRTLGHRSVMNTMKYIQLEESLFKDQDEQFVCKAARSVQEAIELIELGYTFVCEVENAKLFRKPK
jgi:integrase